MRRRRPTIKSKRPRRHDSDEGQVRHRDHPRAGAGEERQDLLRYQMRFEELMATSPRSAARPQVLGLKAVSASTAAVPLATRGGVNQPSRASASGDTIQIRAR
jgi:hypothetical protein